MRSDVFSLGAVFYELLANHKPFDADSMHAVFFQVLEHEPLPVRQWDAELPEVMVPFLAKALAKDPAQRYQHAGEMRDGPARGPPAPMQRRGLGRRRPGRAQRRRRSGCRHPAPTWSRASRGSSALAPERRRAACSRARCPERSATATGTEAAQPVGHSRRRSRGVVVALALGGGVFVWQRSRDARQHRRGGGHRQLVMAKLDLARTKLEIKDYRAADTEARPGAGAGARQPGRAGGEAAGGGRAAASSTRPLPRRGRP